MNSTYDRALAMFRLAPDEIMRAAATCHIEPSQLDTCYVGTLAALGCEARAGRPINIRESTDVAGAIGLQTWFAPTICAHLFGGSGDEWSWLFYEAASDWVEGMDERYREEVGTPVADAWQQRVDEIGQFAEV